jgi:hypothetical protein
MSGWVIQANNDLPLSAWERLLASCPDANVFHTPDMMRVFSDIGETEPHVLGAVNTASGEIDALLASTLISQFRLPPKRLTSRAVAFGGILCRAPAALPLLLSTYSSHMARRALFTEIRNISDAGPLRPQMLEASFLYESHLNFLIDLSRGQESVWRRIDKDARKNIRRTLDRGATIREVADQSDLDCFYRIVKDTYSRRRVPLLGLPVFRNAWRDLTPKRMARFWIMQLDGKSIAARAILQFHGVTYDWYAGSLYPAPRGLYPNETMVWHAIKECLSADSRSFDFGGAGRPDQSYGVRDFKKKFNGTLVEYGRFRQIHAPILFPVLERAYALYRPFVGLQAH